MINTINNLTYSHDFLNKNQYAFTPQRSTIDVAMVVKDFVEEGLAAGELVSVDVKGAFGAAW